MIKNDIKKSKTIVQIQQSIILYYIVKKRFYTRETLTIPRLSKIPTLYRDWLRSLK